MKLSKSDWIIGADDDEQEDQYKSFTDIFAAVCLTFFLIMLIFNVLNSYSGGRIDKMIAAEESFSAIAEGRSGLYMNLADRLQNIPGLTDVAYDEENNSLSIGFEVFFAKGSSAIRPEAMESIESLSGELFSVIDGMLDENGVAYVADGVRFDYFEIRGHTDTDSDGVYNRRLSLERAMAVVNAMLPRDSAAEAAYGRFFLASGMSEFRNAVPTDGSEETHQLNRRVELIIRFDDKDIDEAVGRIAGTLRR